MSHAIGYVTLMIFGPVLRQNIPLSTIRYTIPGLTILLLLALSGCNGGPTEKNQGDAVLTAPVFELVDHRESGLYFNNEFKETEAINILTYEYIYNGSGVAVGDVNNDGLPDVFLGGNLFGGRLFLNKGDLKFEQISETAGVFVRGFTTGVSMIDINNDGWLDIYICRSLSNVPDLRKNVLLINNGNNTFTDQAEAYGLADNGYSQQAVFFDYDKDGDLDVYIANHREDFQNALTLGYTPDSNPEIFKYNRDKLYRNNGNNTFTDVTREAGINNSAFTLNVLSADLNNDSWPDLYISCDYAGKDRLLLNNRDGTFRDVIDEQLFHISRNSMGADIADINNDGWMDIMTLDMMAEDNFRQKLLKGQSPYDWFHTAQSYGLHYQVMRNCLHLNNGNGTFSEIGQLAGVSHTDWSWSALFADFDNDGWKDLHITNGYYRDVTDLDHIKFASDFHKAATQGINPFDILQRMTQSPIPNYVFKNEGGLSFRNYTRQWGMEHPSFSNGAVYVDLDLDGDLKVICNNFNQPASLYKNMARETNKNNYLQVRCHAGPGNSQGYGARVWLFAAQGMQVQELNPTRGFLSSVSATLHFGLGRASQVDKVVVAWANGKMQVIENPGINRIIDLDIKNATLPFEDPLKSHSPLRLTDVSGDIRCDYRHIENPFIDFKREPLMEEMYSNRGPCMAVGDVNGDGLEDIYLGGSAGTAGSLLIQQGKSFRAVRVPAWEADAVYEDSDAVFFDVDGDGDLDLYVASGSNEATDPGLYQDRLYLNDGKGNFSAATHLLPPIRIHTACLAVMDFDGDGDPDIFLGGGVVSGHYPRAHPSMLLENDKGRFRDASGKLPEKGMLGIISQARVADVLGSTQTPQLLVAGHWTGIGLLKYSDNRLVRHNAPGLDAQYGLWNCIQVADFDGDGDLDIVAGNRGLNSFYKADAERPARLYFGDFDGNGNIDALPAYHFSDGVLYPKHTMDELFAQIPVVRKWFTTYRSYAEARMDDILSKAKGVKYETLTINNFATMYFENQGNGVFKASYLPERAQISVVRDMYIDDLNGDGLPDMVFVGNQYGADVEMGRYDAGIGQVLLNASKGSFEAMPPHLSNFKVVGDARRVKGIDIQGQKHLVIAIQNGNLIFYRL
ncbi:MAG: VCBS repeat-containing protein [Saprospiraceae bacterium]|nr:VCBS repeat-containing protein [Saprospiraceae bacterium]